MSASTKSLHTFGLVMDPLLENHLLIQSSSLATKGHTCTPHIYVCAWGLVAKYPGGGIGEYA